MAKWHDSCFKAPTHSCVETKAEHTKWQLGGQLEVMIVYWTGVEYLLGTRPSGTDWDIKTNGIFSLSLIHI